MSTPPSTTNPTSSSAQPQSQPKIQIIDDKSPHCIPFILSLLSSHLSSPEASQPFVIGLNGIQGSGKTTLVSSLHTILSSPPYSHPTLVLSIDDLYLPYPLQSALAASHPTNALIQHRGEPGTHDVELGVSLFKALREGKECKVPRYDKSLHRGKGDRIPSETWKSINKHGEEKLKIIILEGWLVGFRTLSSSSLRERIGRPSKTLIQHKVNDLEFVNEELKPYEEIWGEMDAFIHIDALETSWVYVWREEQEAKLREEKGEGGGMSKEEVKRFVDGYFPAYELYTDALREGVFKGREGMEGRQMRLVIGRDRRVKSVVRI